MTVRAISRKGGKYTEAREWALKLIAEQKDGVSSSEMSDMMVEQFGHTKSAMSHTLHGMVRIGALRIIGVRVVDGKRTHVLVANKRKSRATHKIVPPTNNVESGPTPGDVSLAVTLTFTTPEGEPLVVHASIAEARAAYKALHAVFGPGVL